MKQTHLFVLSFFLLLSTSIYSQDSLSTEQQKSGNMIVRINNLSSDEGKVMIALTNSKENYNGRNAFRGAAADIKDGKAEYVFENIPFGEYAVKCYHDENMNGKLDSNMMGIPKEKYAFSNNAKGTFGPASYEDAKFTFTTDNQFVVLDID